MTSQRKLAIIVFCGLMFACLYHFGLMGEILHRGYPHNTFLFNTDWLFSDFYEPTKLAATGNPYNASAGLRSVYPPLMNISALAFAQQMFMRPSDLYLLFTALALGLAGWLTFRDSDKAKTALNVMGGMLASYPVVYLIQRGNLEIVSFMFLFAGVFLYSKKHYPLAAISMGLSAACKIYPVVFIILFMADRKYREVLLFAASAAAASIAGFMYFEGGLLKNFLDMVYNMQFYKAEYVGKSYGLVFGHSLYGALQTIRCWFMGLDPVYTSPGLIKFYPYLAVVLGLFITWRTVLETELWKKITLLTVMMLALPFVSADYRLISLFAPLWLFFQAGETRHKTAYLWLFALLLIPKNYFYFVEPEVSVSAFINPLLLLGLAALIISEQKPPATPVR